MIFKNYTNRKDNNKSGLIILAGNQCSLGITLEWCDVVILLNDILSSDKIYQMMYRCMTEAHNKKCGFVVDLNINRVLNTIMDYSCSKKDLNSENKIRYIVENNLIHIDSDYLLNKQVSNEGIIKNLLEVWKKDPINGLRKLLKNIEDEILEINNEDQESLNNIFTKSFDKNNKDEILLGDEEEPKQELPDGKTIKKEVNDIDSDKESEVKISLTKDVLPFIIPLSCFLTIKDNNKNFLEMLNIIKYNEELLDIFNEQTFIWWNKSDVIDLINCLIKKYIKENSDIYNITIYIKMTIQSLIDKPIELLNFINERLKPKDIEKKKYGEVFTPIHLIEEMLDKLPIEVWSNPNLKWFDPANGMGNFMIAIYFRLTKGLKDSIPNEELRKKHILENMLYMSEINKKNCFLTKQIFDINNYYKLNIYTGDSLTLDTLKEWNIEKFDIIVGNPPYQDDTGNKGNKLYPKFVELSINILLKDNGYLLFVHPSLWRHIDHELGILMKSKQIIYLEIHNEKDGQKMFTASTRYDWYLIQNIKYEYNTIIKDENGIVCNINISNMRFIPNCCFDIISKITSSDIKLEILHSESVYEPRKAYMNSVKTNEFKYPCIYSINKNNEPKFRFSSINNKGHFNVCKIIWETTSILNIYKNL
jgi:hypothetical protein